MGLKKIFSGFSFLSKTQLVKLKLKAVRAGVWFRALSRVDRALVDLTIAVASAVRSSALASRLLTVVGRLEELLENRLSRAMKEVGFPLARKLSLVAQKWGNVSAELWASDVGFVRYLAVLHINAPAGFNLQHAC